MNVIGRTAIVCRVLGQLQLLGLTLDFGKCSPCVLLFDEIDAIAKRRDDDTDSGERKRLISVILHEVDGWPATGLHRAGTNHAELIGQALRRRFDPVTNFKAPEMSAVKQAIKRFLGPDYAWFGRWIDRLTFASSGGLFHWAKYPAFPASRLPWVRSWTPTDWELVNPEVKLGCSRAGRERVLPACEFSLKGRPIQLRRSKRVGRRHTASRKSRGVDCVSSLKTKGSEVRGRQGTVAPV